MRGHDFNVQAGENDTVNTQMKPFSHHQVNGRVCVTLLTQAIQFADSGVQEGLEHGLGFGRPVTNPLEICSEKCPDLRMHGSGCQNTMVRGTDASGVQKFHVQACQAFHRLVAYGKKIPFEMYESWFSHERLKTIMDD